jgi:hypothetical protein
VYALSPIIVPTSIIFESPTPNNPFWFKPNNPYHSIRSGTVADNIGDSFQPRCTQQAPVLP